jgi:hypothetical protein
MKMEAILRNSFAALFFFVCITLPILSHSQAADVCPGISEGNPPNNTLPLVIFPVAPVAGESWYVCYQNPRPCESAYPPSFSGATAQPHLAVTATADGFELKTQWIQVPFGICPYTAYLRAVMPTVPQAGPVTVRMVQRTASGVTNLPFFPFVTTFEQVIQVRASGVSSFAVPALDWRASLALCGLIVGVMAIGRR